MATVTLRPTGDGTYRQFKIYPTTPPTHYDKVDEVTPNDGTDYITSMYGDGLAHDVYDTFLKPSSGIPPGSTINRVTVYSNGRMTPTPSGLKTHWRNCILIDGTLYTAGFFQNTSWTTVNSVWATNPKTGLPWTLSDVEALLFGVFGTDRYDAVGDESWVDVTAVWLVIDYTPPVGFPRWVGDGLAGAVIIALLRRLPKVSRYPSKASSTFQFKPYPSKAFKLSRAAWALADSMKSIKGVMAKAINK